MEFDRIVLRYDGLIADEHMIDLAQVGQSLQGAAQLLGTAGSIVSTGEYSRRLFTMPVRVYADVPRDGCFEVPVFLLPAVPELIKQFPLMADFGKKLATRQRRRL